eukprot:SAG11_NODE_37704_length_255_cov_1.634615_1_plen_78_part_01
MRELTADYEDEEPKGGWKKEEPLRRKELTKGVKGKLKQISRRIDREMKVLVHQLLSLAVALLRWFGTAPKCILFKTLP